jgi:O-antigen/teichoic acid export membrane protein
LAINAILARLLRPGELGAYFTIYSLVFLGSIFGRLGMDRAAVRFVSVALGKGEPGRARDAIRIVFAIGAAGALVVGLLSAALGGWLARQLYDSEVIAAAMPLAAAWLVISVLRTLVVETFRGFQRFGLATIFDSLLVDVLTAVVFGSLLLLSLGSDVRQVVALSTALAGVSALIGAALLLRQVRNLRGKGRVGRDEVLSMTWPVVIGDVASYLLSTGIDLWILAAFRPPSEVALYGAASRLLVILVMPFHIFRGVAPPLIAELHAQRRLGELERAVRSGATLAAIPALAVLAVFMLFGSSVMEAVYGPFYGQGASILAILSLGRLALVWTGSSGVALLMTGHHRAMMYITVISAGLSVGSGILAAASYGPVGIAATTTAAAILQNLLQLFLAKRYVGVWTHAYFGPRPLLRFLRKESFVDETPHR